MNNGEVQEHNEVLDDKQAWLDSLTVDELFMYKVHEAMRRGNVTKAFAFNIVPGKESNE